MSLSERLAEYVAAAFTGLWVQSHEHADALSEIATLCRDRGWSLATVKTMLSRLATKGALKHREDGRRFLYSPAIKREAYVGTDSRRFVERLFGGRLSPLVARLAEEDALDEDDIAAIQALLKELKS